MASFPCIPAHNVQFNYAVNTGILAISWQGSSSSYNLRYRTVNGSWITIGNTTLTSYSFNAAQATYYGFEIVSVCSGQLSRPLLTGHTTETNQIGASNIVVTDKGRTHMRISWSGSAGEYLITWVNENNPKDIYQDRVNANTYHIQYLDPDVNYRIFVNRIVGQQSIPAANNQYIDKDNCCCESSAVNPDNGGGLST